MVPGGAMTLGKQAVLNTSGEAAGEGSTLDPPQFKQLMRKPGWHLCRASLV